MILRGNLKRLAFFAMTAFFLLSISTSTFGQAIYDSFADGNFTAAPVWGGTTTEWVVDPNSAAAAGATGSQTVRLNANGGSGPTDYLSSQISTFGSSQEWGIFIGRRSGQAFTAGNQQYFWLYANEANLNSATVDGYRIAIGDDTGNDEIRLEYIVNGAVNTTVITSTGALTDGLTDIGFLVRVTRRFDGRFQLFTSVLPVANGAGAVATDVPNAANTTVNQGIGTNNSLIPANNGYIGLAALHTNGLAARTNSAEFDQVAFSPLAPTAAGATAAGRVTLPNGRGIFRAVVTMTDSQGNVQTAYTDQQGYFNFTDVPGGETYIFTATHRRFQFAVSSQVQFIAEDNPGINFVATDGGIFFSPFFRKE